MKKLRKFAALLLPVFLLFALVPPFGQTAKAEGISVVSVITEEELENAISAASSGDVIEIAGSITINDNKSDSAPWVINKAVTLRGTGSNPTLTLRAGGIVLGADVAFENLTLAFANRVRNAIMANGYTLSLRNVTCSSSVPHKVHLFCGGMTTEGTPQYAASGSHGALILNDCKNFGNIYAGNISSDGKSNSFDQPATVTIQSGESGSFGTLYGCGALETPVDSDLWFDTTYEVSPPTANPELYRATGKVQFQLYYNTASKVDGATGGNENAAVTYTAGPLLNSSLILKNISSLTLAGEANLQPEVDSFFDENTAISVPANTTLNLSQLSGNPVIGDFSGGGRVILGISQTLTINGLVSENTQIAVGWVSSDGATSASPVTHGKILVTAPNSQEGSFSLLPYSGTPNMTFHFEEGGIWRAYDPNHTDRVLVKSLQVANIEAAAGQSEIKIPFSLEFDENSASISRLVFVPLGITINNKSTVPKNDADNYSYSWNNTDAFFTIEVYEEDSDYFLLTGDNGVTIPNGTYQFNITIPEKHSATGFAIQVPFILQVGEPEIVDGKQTVTTPVAFTNLRYTGQEQTGVPEGNGYTLSGHKATDAGNYTATASPKNGYQWNDGSTSNKSIPWSIEKKESPAAPSGVKAAAPSAEGRNDGKITGVDATMEYASNSNFTDAKPCPAKEITGLSPGTYYIRVKETGNQEAGKTLSVTVPNFGSSEDGSGGDDGSEEGDGSDGGEDDTTPGTPTAIPVTGGQGSVQVNASISGSTVTVTEISADQFSTAMGGTIKTGAMQIDLSGLKEKIDTVKLPAGTIRQISEAGQNSSNRVTGLTVKLSTGEVTFNNKAMAALYAQTDKQLALSIAPAKDTELNAAQKNTAGSAPVFSLTLQSGGKTITGFRGGEATVSLPCQLTEGQQPSGIVLYYLDNEGKTQSCKTKYNTQAKTATFYTSHFSLYLVGYDPAIVWENPFSDITEDAWYWDAVRSAEKNGWMGGYGNGLFGPEKPFSRAQAAQLLYNWEGKPGAGGTNRFQDVEAGAWYEKSITWAAGKGILEGYGNGLFGPDNNITREQLAVLFWRYAGSPNVSTKTLDFTDAHLASHWAKDALRWAVENDLITGKNGNILDPQGTATRAEVATIFCRFAEYKNKSLTV